LTFRRAAGRRSDEEADVAMELRMSKNILFRVIVPCLVAAGACGGREIEVDGGNGGDAIGDTGGDLEGTEPEEPPESTETADLPADEASQEEDAAEEELPADPLRVGGDATFEIATWNLHNFPENARTPSRVAELVRRMDIDLVAVQEVNDAWTFDEILQGLPGYERILVIEACTTSTFQMTAFIYRTSVVEPGSIVCDFMEEGVAFPRPPLEADFTVRLPGSDPMVLIVIDVHLKAGVAEEDESRRRDAVAFLEGRIAWIAASSSADGVILLGDMNDELGDAPTDNVFGPFLENPAAYAFLTAPLDASGAYSYIPYRRLIDQIMVTNGLLEAYGDGTTMAMPLDTTDIGYDYESQISDHRPVVAVFAGP
jgi:endonuclease/exonuclease/phosphatase family metal-dependent hydrolase